MRSCVFVRHMCLCVFVCGVGVCVFVLVGHTCSCMLMRHMGYGSCLPVMNFSAVSPMCVCVRGSYVFVHVGASHELWIVFTSDELQYCVSQVCGDGVCVCVLLGHTCSYMFVWS